MNAQHRAKVEFPIAGPLPSLNRVEVIAYPDKQDGRVSCPGKSTLGIKKLIGHSRYDEDDIDKIEIDVVVRFDRSGFEGQSYGLALALADKQARWSNATQFDRIIATGVLEEQGRVARVDGFAAKIGLLKPTPNQKILFVFPKQNLDDDPTAIECLSDKNILLRPVSHLIELRDLWQEHETTVTPQTVWNRRSTFLRGLSLGFSIVIVSVCGMILLQFIQ